MGQGLNSSAQLGQSLLSAPPSLWVPSPGPSAPSLWVLSSGPSAHEQMGGGVERHGQAGWGCQLDLGNSTPCPPLGTRALCRLEAPTTPEQTNKQTDWCTARSWALISGPVDLAALSAGGPSHMGSQLSICLSTGHTSSSTPGALRRRWGLDTQVT